MSLWKMRDMTVLTQESNPNMFLNPEILWAIENELINIPPQYRDSFWNELLASYVNDKITK